MARTYPEYKYDLAEELLQELSDLAVSVLTQEKSGHLGNFPDLPALEKFLGEYGERLAERILTAGSKYKDRCTEVMGKMVSLGGPAFPCIPQRYLEIWFLATRPQDDWRLCESTTKRLIFEVSECFLYRWLKEKLSFEGSLPCRQYCLTVLSRFFKGLKIPVEVTITHTMEKETRCRFCSQAIEFERECSHDQGSFTGCI